MIELVPIFLFILYIVPFSVAAGRDHPALIPILLCNLLLGWTVIGWFAVLAWAWFAPQRGPASRVAVSGEGSSDRGHGPVRPRIMHDM